MHDIFGVFFFNTFYILFVIHWTLQKSEIITELFEINRTYHNTCISILFVYLYRFHACSNLFKLFPNYFQRLWGQLVLPINHSCLILDPLLAVCRAHHLCIPWCSSQWCHLVIGCTKVGLWGYLPHHRPHCLPSSPRGKGTTHRWVLK